MENDFGKAHGLVFFDPDTRLFIQVREHYFNSHSPRNYGNAILKTGHFTTYLDDAKNNTPEECLRFSDLSRLINVEEVGLNNIPNVYYEAGVVLGWRGKEKERCPRCGKYIEE